MLNGKDIDKSKLSPMMQHYLETKEKYPGTILFYRLGDFYEMFFEDAELVSRELELTLTGKACGLEERAPMCGVPFHAVDTYLNKLVNNGHKVAICEQLEDPKEAKGIVKRDVIKVVTPGTNLNMQSLEEGKNNFIMSVVYFADTFGVAAADISTGDFFVTELDSKRKLMDEITKYMPSELIANNAFFMSGVDTEELVARHHIMINRIEESYFTDASALGAIKKHFKVLGLEGLGLSEFDIGAHASGALLLYLQETQKSELENITKILPYRQANYMIIDTSTRRNLELTETLREKQKRGSLLWVLDSTRTAMGARLLRSIIEQPLINSEDINARLDAVEELNGRIMDRD